MPISLSLSHVRNLYRKIIDPCQYFRSTFSQDTIDIKENNYSRKLYLIRMVYMLQPAQKFIYKDRKRTAMYQIRILVPLNLCGCRVKLWNFFLFFYFQGSVEDYVFFPSSRVKGIFNERSKSCSSAQKKKTRLIFHLHMSHIPLFFRI